MRDLRTAHFGRRGDALRSQEFLQGLKPEIAAEANVGAKAPTPWGKVKNPTRNYGAWGTRRDAEALRAQRQEENATCWYR
jgi:hypothetical protein